MKKNLVILATVGTILLTGCTSPGTPSAPQAAAAPGSAVIGSQVISVTTKESVTVIPDMAEIIIGVVNQDPDAKACQDKNAESVNALIAVLKENGITETSIQTTNHNLSTQNDWNKNGEIIGYEMSTELTIKDIPLDQVGDILASSVGTGANQIRSVSYLSSQYDASYEEALKKAVAKAGEKAQALAEAAGCTLGPVAGITEYTDNQTARYREGSAVSMQMDNASTGAGAARMMAGEISIEANISVEYVIQ
ncbi:MAG: SIMPL domain-containing protein [Lachnospiraceae bacterium]